MSESRWWRCCRRFRKKPKADEKSPKLGWIMGVLVREGGEERGREK